MAYGAHTKNGNLESSFFSWNWRKMGILLTSETPSRAVRNSCTWSRKQVTPPPSLGKRGKDLSAPLIVHMSSEHAKISLYSIIYSSHLFPSVDYPYLSPSPLPPSLLVLFCPCCSVLKVFGDNGDKGVHLGIDPITSERVSFLSAWSLKSANGINI